MLLVIGDGFDQGPGAELKRRACAKIHFLGLKNNVADYLCCSDAFCLTSIYEGLPISLLEAMACGVVPICTRIGGIPDVVADGKNGYLSEVSLNAYMSALERYLNEAGGLEDLVKYFESRFSMSSCAAKYMDIYETR